MGEVFCEACSEDCGLRLDGERGRCAACFAHGEVSLDEDEGCTYGKFITSKLCRCHLDEDECEAHVEWMLTPMAGMLAELQIQVAQEAERQSGWSKGWWSMVRATTWGAVA